ncbi:TRM11 family methyltransferase [Methanohalobium sp.]|uniref:TRM11 family SAM-dependent methyltransferase n=1 Tax=Methanohalobium sp. TaxID=2837493 RepID=UPI0025D2E1DB|nr:TRM11 family methyltransferase [Methanohalobium sp.]
MLYAFDLSGEHESLPVFEIFACLDVEELEYSEYAHFDQCLVVDISENNKEVVNKLNSVSNRLAMSHSILKVAGICDTDFDDILKTAENLNINKHITPGQTYAVRVNKVKHYTSINGEQLEKKVGGCIYRKGNEKSYRVNLNNPDIEFRLILTDKCIMGSVVAKVDRSCFEYRVPHKRPFFYPGVLMPRMARTVVNLSKVKSGETLFDPFCGTAGILMEAGLVDVNCIGLEVQYKIMSGARMNLDDLNLDYSLLMGDACRLPFVDESMDAIVTDPPYGKSALIKAESMNYLYAMSFIEMYRVLKKGKYAVIVTGNPVKELVKDAGFVLHKEHHQRVHRSLTRIVSVLYKK